MQTGGKQIGFIEFISHKMEGISQFTCAGVNGGLVVKESMCPPQLIC